MSDNKNELAHMLQQLNLTRDEATLYLQLLREPQTPLQLSRATALARTKVYRLVEQLTKRSLVSWQTDHRGSFAVAGDPATLEVELQVRAAKIKQQHETLASLIPSLASLKNRQPPTFVMRNYEGDEGLKQMCWHELKTQGELLALSDGFVEELSTGHRWAEKHRALSVRAGYRVRSIVNQPYENAHFTSNEEYLRNYSYRIISPDILPLHLQTIIYNDTVAIYYSVKGDKAGAELISQGYAAMMRSLFNHYWDMAQPA